MKSYDVFTGLFYTVENPRLDAEMSAMKAQQLQTTAAFSAHLSQDTTMNDGAVIFPEVDVNVGGGYDANTGKLLHADIV